MRLARDPLAPVVSTRAPLPPVRAGALSRIVHVGSDVRRDLRRPAAERPEKATERIRRA
ncbi:hypothetical protein [Streptomyces sp. SID12488]|uniref:hypothetical protein n=1 Tax=Streptomyces sp. SID12488 TaxID=2706040 RepID=UPI0013D9C29E|nr:hypothetical protein [Streptomyces sp. SID12488]